MPLQISPCSALLLMEVAYSLFAMPVLFGKDETEGEHNRLPFFIILKQILPA
jgi:hypothetical protein